MSDSVGKSTIYGERCPEAPCGLCKGFDATGKLTSWEWCQQVNTCAATIDWDAIGEERMRHAYD